MFVIGVGSFKFFNNFYYSYLGAIDNSKCNCMFNISGVLIF